MLEPIPFAGMVDIDMSNELVELTQGDILGILQDANSVPLGQPIFNSSEEYNKLKAIIESAIRYAIPHFDNLGLAESIIKQQELEIKRLKTIIEAYKIRPRGKSEFAKAILKKASEK